MKTCNLLLGILLLATLATSAAVRYVDLSSPSPIPPFTSWATAATNIQDAVDAAAAGDEIVVTNGVYATGGRAIHGTMTNRVAVNKAVRVRSVNGSQFTVIQGTQAPGTITGDSAVRCVYLTNAATLVGFTLANGATKNSGDLAYEQSGGGIWCEPGASVSNCVLVENTAKANGGGVYQGMLNNCTFTNNSADVGGGSYYSILTNCIVTENTASLGGGSCGGILANCVLTWNFASNQGGGTDGGTLNFCTLSSNSSFYGGGAYNAILNNSTIRANRATRTGGGVQRGTLNNCLLIANSADGGGGAYDATLNNCTISGNTARIGAGGIYYGNSSNSIVFYNTNGNYAGMAPKWSCTYPLPGGGLGNFTNAPLFVDAVGWSNLRLKSNSPCINAGRNIYTENVTDLDGLARLVGGTVDIGAYEFQSPASSLSYIWAQQYGLPTDGSADYLDPDADEMNNWKEWRCLTDPTNSLSLLKLLPPTSGISGITVSWQSVGNRTYRLERASNLDMPPVFSILTSNLAGVNGSKSYLDTNVIGPGPFFYRVGVGN